MIVLITKQALLLRLDVFIDFSKRRPCATINGYCPVSQNSSLKGHLANQIKQAASSPPAASGKLYDQNDFESCVLCIYKVVVNIIITTTL